MKCAHCSETVIAFTIIPEMSGEIAWASHVISEVGGKCGLYHYQCGEVNLNSIAIMFSDMVNEDR